MFNKSNDDTYYHLFLFYLDGSKLSKYSFCHQRKLSTCLSRMLSISGLRLKTKLQSLPGLLDRTINHKTIKNYENPIKTIDGKIPE